MAAFCLLPSQQEAFKDAIADGSLDLEALSGPDVSSEDRRAAFLKVFGDAETAKNVNADMESKLILKNQQTALINFAKKELGMNNPRTTDIMSKVNRLTKVLQPNDPFLADLVERRLGVKATTSQVAQLSDLSKQLASLKAAIPESDPNGSKARLEYGSAKVAFNKYYQSLLDDADQSTIGEKLSEASIDPLRSGLNAASEISRAAREVKGILDNSSVLRTLPAAALDPKIWAKSSVKTIGDLINGMKKNGGTNVMDAVNADIWSRKNALNGNYNNPRFGQNYLSKADDELPESLIEKLPVAGRAAAATRAAWQANQTRIRADLFDKFLAKAEKQRSSPRGLWGFINSATNRGSFAAVPGGEAGASFVSNFLNIRSLKAKIDILTAIPKALYGAANEKRTGGQYYSQKDSKGNHVHQAAGFAQRQAAYGVLKYLTVMAGVVGIAKALWPKNVNTDPTASDSFQLQDGSGNTIDVTQGLASIARLVFREAEQKSTSASGKVTDVNAGPFSPAGIDLFNNFIEDKTTPAGTLIRDMLNHTTFSGDKLNATNAIADAATPYTLQDYESVKNDPNALLLTIASALGVQVSAPETKTYSAIDQSNPDAQKITNELQALSAVPGVKLSNPDPSNPNPTSRFGVWLSKLSPDAQAVASTKFQTLYTDALAKAMNQPSWNSPQSSVYSKVTTVNSIEEHMGLQVANDKDLRTEFPGLPENLPLPKVGVGIKVQ